MDMYQASILLCRGFAIYFAYQALILLTHTFFNFSMREPFTVLYVFLNLFLEAFLSAIFWFKSEKLAHFITSVPASKKSTSLTYENLQQVALVAVGFFILARAVNPLTQFVSALIQVKTNLQGNLIVVADNLWRSGLNFLFLAALGLFLIFSSKAISSFIQKARGKV